VKEGEVPPVPENRFLSRAFTKDKEKEKGKDDDKKRSRRDRSRSRHRSRSRSRGKDSRRDRDNRSGTNKNEKEAPRYGRVGRNNNDGKKVKGRGRVVSIFIPLKRI